MKDLLFAVTAILTLGFAFYAALSRNVVYSAFGLLASLAGVAGLYIFLSGDFLAAVQLLVYVGGVMVLFLFALMVTGGIEVPAASNPARRVALALVAVVPFLLASAFFVSAFAEHEGAASVAASSGSATSRVYSPITAAVGRSLIERHMASFEALSVLLLVALLAAVAIVRKTIAAPDARATAKRAGSPGETSSGSNLSGGRP